MSTSYLLDLGMRWWCRDVDVDENEDVLTGHYCAVVKNDPNPCTDVVLVVQVTGNTVSPGGL